MELPLTVFIDGVHHFQPCKALSKLRKNELIRLLVRDFVTTCAALVVLGFADLVVMLPNLLCGHQLCAIMRIICCQYCKRVAVSLCKPLSTAYANTLSPDSAMSIDLPVWMNALHHDMLLVMLCLPKQTILDYLKHIPSYARPSYNSRFINSRASALVNHIRHRISHITTLSDVAFWDVLLTVHPFDCLPNDSRALLTEKLIQEEYGDDVILIIAVPCLSKRVEQKNQCQAAKLQSVQDAIAFEKDMVSSWPRVVEDDVIFQCLEDYRMGTVWTPCPICCVCGLE